MARVGRMNAAELTAREDAIDEYLPSYITPDDHQDWVPLIPHLPSSWEHRESEVTREERLSCYRRASPRLAVASTGRH